MRDPNWIADHVKDPFDYIQVDPTELDRDANEEHASYILEQTIDIALRAEEYRRRIRFLQTGNFVIRLNPTSGPSSKT